MGKTITTFRFEPYFDRSLGIRVNSRREKSAILKSRGLVEVGGEEIKVPTQRDQPILTDKEWYDACQETQISESGDA